MSTNIIKYTTLIISGILLSSFLLQKSEKLEIDSKLFDLFNIWKIQYGKRYNSPKELDYRFQVFGKNLEYIQNLNG